MRPATPLNVLSVISILIAALPSLAAAQEEAVPPLQPPYPTAPPPQTWPMAVRPFGFGHEASLYTEDAVAALAVRGFFQIATPSQLATMTEPALNCLRQDRQSYDCVQQAVSGASFRHIDTVNLVFVVGRLEGDTLSWTCVGHSRIVTVDFLLGDFFTPNLSARQTSRNRALACIERAVGLDRTSEHKGL